MTSDLAVPTWLAVATGLALVVLVVVAVRLTVAARRTRARCEALLDAATHDAEALRTRLAGIEAQLRARQEATDARQAPPVAVVDDREYVITDLGQQDGPRIPARVVPAPLFADILLRESVIRSASLAAGLRRALSPAARNRIRFEMRREVKRSRRKRKQVLKQVRRDTETLRRASVEPAS